MSRVVKALRRLMFTARVRERARRRWHDGWFPFCLLLALVVAGEGWSLFSASPPLRAAGRQPYLVVDFAAGAPIGQTFRMKGDGLASVRLQFFTDRSRTLKVLCTLLGVEPPLGWVSRYQWIATIDLPSGWSWQAFHFPAVVPSDRRVYQFRVQRIEARAERPGDRPTMGLVASADDGLKDGNIVDGPTQVVDQDLYFEARADDSAWSIFRRDVNPLLPERLRSMSVQLTILALYNLALAVVLYDMAFARPTSIEPW